VQKKEESRERILTSAGALIRKKGIAGTSVSEVMGGAGMTVGGFYAHFPSKDELVAETISSALSQSLEGLKAGAGDKRGAEWLKAAARSYLSRAHRDNPTAGCPLPATAGEMANTTKTVRRALGSEIDAIAAEIATHEEEAGQARPRQEALATLAMMVGGLTLARALRETPLSDEVLKSCRSHMERCLEVQ
jgi:TetR/AcrR family transcriptional regulator, transcriptional repressor for nem operon